VSSAVNVDFNVFGGKSLSNASIALNGGKNTTYKSGQLISVDAGTEAVILVQAKDWRFRSVSFEFNYAVSGEQYSDDFTEVIIAIVLGSIGGLIIVISFILCLTYWIRRRKDRVISATGNISLDHMPLE
jgi:hypothetical protein